MSAKIDADPLMQLLCEEVLAPPLHDQVLNDGNAALADLGGFVADCTGGGQRCAAPAPSLGSNHQLLTAALADPSEDVILMPGSCSMLPDPPRSPPRFVMVDRSGPLPARSPEQDHRARLQSGIQAWLQSDSGVTHHFQVRHPNGPNAGALSLDAVVEQCAMRVCGVRDADWNCKIGIARNPEQRLECYRREEGVRKMIVLHKVHDTPQDAIDLECRLIGQFMGTMQCRNRAPGGEGVHTLCTPLWVYVVAGGAQSNGLSLLLERALFGKWPRAKNSGTPVRFRCGWAEASDASPPLCGHGSDSNFDSQESMPTPQLPPAQ